MKPKHPASPLRPATPLCVLALLTCLVPPVTAQDAPKPPFDAVVRDPIVQVRSGAGRAYYEVGSMNQGTRVRVEAELFGWYKIACPEGVFCFVERKNINVRGDGTRGVVEVDNTPVNAAHATKGPADSYRNLLKLDAGDTVRIVATVNNAYKIEPPVGAFVFLPPGSVAPVGNTPPPPEGITPERVAPQTSPEPAPAAVGPPTPRPAPDPVFTPAPDPAEVVPPAPEPVVVVTPPPPAVVEAQPDAVPQITLEIETTAEQAGPSAAADADLLDNPDVDVPLPDAAVTTEARDEMLRAVEVAMLPYFTLPVSEQPIAKMVRGYADAASLADLGANDMAIVQARLTELERNRELALAMRKVDAVAAEVGEPVTPEATPEAAPEADPTDSTASVVVPAANASDPSESTPAATPGGTSGGYDAVGILTASTVHTGGNQPQLFRLLDPTGRRTIAYLEPADVDTVQMLGRLVGVVGSTQYDPSTRLNLIEPDRIDVLSPD
ncbi:MAG: hypothetical protein AAF800_10605 [Planctomycetota bacterium]